LCCCDYGIGMSTFPIAKVRYRKLAIDKKSFVRHQHISAWRASHMPKLILLQPSRRLHIPVWKSVGYQNISCCRTQPFLTTDASFTTHPRRPTHDCLKLLKGSLQRYTHVHPAVAITPSAVLLHFWLFERRVAEAYLRQNVRN
jgi:hypothetical protein